MSDQETLATSDSPSVPNRIAEKARPLHPTQASYHKFCSYYQDTSDDLASKYLELLKDLVAELNLDEFKLQTLLNFANGATITSWNETVEQWKITKSESTKEKFVRLAFIRRYPGFYEREQGTLVERAQYLELPVKSGLVQLKAKHTPPSALGLDVIEAGYKSDYLRYHEIVAPTIQTLDTYVTLWQSGIYLAPYTCLIGPTMIGKTRLLMKMAEEMCVVYICLRPEDSTGEPKRSLLATDMLPPSSPNFKAYYIKIIAAVFLVTAKFFQLTPISNLKKRYKEWNEHQTTPTFHRDVLQELRTSEQITDENDIAKYLTDAVTTVQQVFPEDPGLKVLLAIDEASAMLEIPQPKNNDVSFFRHFRRALRTIPDQARVFAILVDTTSRVSNFLPISREDNSSRALGTRGKPSQLFPPIYKIRTFDLMAPPRKSLTWQQLFMSDRLSQYGVPFFSLYLEHSLKLGRAISYDTAIPSILHFALTKLLRSEDVTDTIKLTEARALALLGPTIGVPLHGQARLNVELTTSHAAHVGYLDPTREYQYSFYPSQPIYALAANNHLRKYETILISCINSLTSILCQGNVESGDAGECASRIILMCAMNETLARINTDRNKVVTRSTKRAKPVSLRKTNDLPTSPWQPVPVSEFLKTLTGQPANCLSLGSIAETHKKKLLDQGMMFWNHFQFFSSTPTAESLMESMERGLAIQCHPQQRAIDQVLPIYLKDDTAKMDKTKMTYCGIQVKNRKDDRTASNYMANMTHSNVKINTNDENPYLMLHFSLRDKDTPEESQGPLEKSTNIKNPQDYQLDEPRKQGNRDKKNKQAEQATRQASFLFHGLNSFTFLSPEVKSALHKLLNIRTNLVTRHAGDPVGQLYAKDFMLCSERS